MPAVAAAPTHTQPAARTSDPHCYLPPPLPHPRAGAATCWKRWQTCAAAYRCSITRGRAARPRTAAAAAPSSTTRQMARPARWRELASAAAAAAPFSAAPSRTRLACGWLAVWLADWARPQQQHAPAWLAGGWVLAAAWLQRHGEPGHPRLLPGWALPDYSRCCCLQCSCALSGPLMRRGPALFSCGPPPHRCHCTGMEGAWVNASYVVRVRARGCNGSVCRYAGLCGLMQPIPGLHAMPPLKGGGGCGSAHGGPALLLCRRLVP